MRALIWVICKVISDLHLNVYNDLGTKFLIGKRGGGGV